MFPGNKYKAVTFSYDDGVTQDKRLVDIFNKYGLKATFNLNSGLQSGASSFIKNDIVIRRLNVEGLKKLYQGHEIAVHTLTHPFLEKQDAETVYNEILQDKKNLEQIFEQNIQGMAYPFGTYNDEVIKIVKDCGIRYSRTVKTTEDFLPQKDLLAFKSTCHHNNPKLMKLAEEFVRSDAKEPQIFYIWGHSYEFEVDQNWEVIEEFCRFISGRDDIFYGTNEEVLLCESLHATQ
jgi:peptidoglycan/xylan/chitin deacetylase (PgdA/CDA1 family)